MHGPAQVPRALAVDDADLENVESPAFLEILRDQVLDFRRTKGVEIKGAVNGDLDRIRFFHSIRFFHTLLASASGQELQGNGRRPVRGPRSPQFLLHFLESGQERVARRLVFK